MQPDDKHPGFYGKMKALLVFALLFGVMALLQGPPDFFREASADRAIALNYAIYRNEVFRHVYRNRGISGDIPLSALNMPESWRPLREWRARVDNGLCYVYGEATPQEIAAVRELFRGSFALGQASSGMLSPAPAGGNAVPVPGFIPNGSLVSVTEAS